MQTLKIIQSSRIIKRKEYAIKTCYQNSILQNCKTREQLLASKEYSISYSDTFTKSINTNWLILIGRLILTNQIPDKYRSIYKKSSCQDNIVSLTVCFRRYLDKYHTQLNLFFGISLQEGHELQHTRIFYFVVFSTTYATSFKLV